MIALLHFSCKKERLKRYQRINCLNIIVKFLFLRCNEYTDRKKGMTHSGHHFPFMTNGRIAVRNILIWILFFYPKQFSIEDEVGEWFDLAAILSPVSKVVRYVETPFRSNGH